MDRSYTLNYFPLTGRGEACRMAFHIATMRFTDNQISFDDWSFYKSDHKHYPLGHIPTLRVCNETICEQMAIMRFLGNEFGIYGANNMEKAEVDQVMETCREIFEGLAEILLDSTLDDDTKKAGYVKFFADQKLRFDFLVSILKKNDSGDFFLGWKTTIAEAYYYPIHEYVMSCLPSAFDDYPELKALQCSIANIFSVRKYLSKRKQKLVK